MSKPRILILATESLQTPLVPGPLAELSKVAEVHWLAPIINQNKSGEYAAEDVAKQHAINLANMVKEHGPFIAFGAIYEIGKSFPPVWNGTYLGPLFPECKLIVTPGAGYDRVDVDYLSSKGCLLANTPTGVGRRTADGAIMLLLAALRGLTAQDHSVRQGNWRDPSCRAIDWRSCTLGIIGVGNIGLQIADAAHALGFQRVVYSNRKPRPDITKYDHVTLDELYAVSDAIMIACPLTAATRGLVDKVAFSKMKDQVIIVNIARGPIVVEDDLVKALESGKVMRAALDVFEEEPKIHPGLLDNFNVTLSPHNTCAPETMAVALPTEIMNNMSQYIKTGLPLTPVNADAVKAI